MKKFFLVVFVFAAALFTMPALFAQADQDAAASKEVKAAFVQVDIKELPVETALVVEKTFEGYAIKAIYQDVETKLLKVVAVKDEEEKTFLQKEEGNFVEQE